MFLYLTADSIGLESGGGLVTFQEAQALKELGNRSNDALFIINKSDLESNGPEPWKWDKAAKAILLEKCSNKWPKLCHIYSGTFSETVELLKWNGCKVCYTIAAHDRAISKREHEKWGLLFPYPHLVEEPLWQQYIRGYGLSNTIITPSTVASKTVRDYGPDFINKRIEIIPHGVNLPKEVKPLPEKFVVGYAGAISPDKGTIYLLQAWKKLNYKDGLLILAGSATSQPWMSEFLNAYGGGNILCLGWVKDISDFYNQISLYVQPSSTEGFGLEVLEAMAHGRVAICADGAGAVDVAPIYVPSCDVDKLADCIDEVKKANKLEIEGLQAREVSKEFTWDKIRAKYINVWESML